MSVDFVAEASKAIAENRLADAMAILGMRLEEAPEDRNALHLFGTAAYRAKDYTTAVTAFRRNTDLPKPHPSYFYSLGRALEATNDRAGALRAYKAAVSADPSMEKAKRRITALEGPAPSAPRPSVSTARAARSQYTIPEQQDLGEYERDTLAKAKIDFKVSNWRSYPGLLKAFIVLVFVGVLAFGGYIAYQALTFGAHQDEQFEQFCQDVRDMGLDPPPKCGD